MKPIIQGPLDELFRRLTALEAEVARLRRTGGSGGLSTVVTDGTLSGNGSTATPLSAADLDSRVDALETGTGSADLYRFSYLADGTEGSELTVPLPYVRTNTNYSVFMENSTTGSFSHNIPSGSRGTSSFKVVLSTAISDGESLDFLIVNHGGNTVGGGGDPTLSGTIDAAIKSLSGTVDARIVDLSGTIDSKFIAVGGGGGNDGIYSAPTTPHPWNIEFDTPGENDNYLWTFSIAGSGSVPPDPYSQFSSGKIGVDMGNHRPSWLLMQPPADNGFYGITLDTSGSFPTDCAVWFRGSISARQSALSNDSTLALILSQTPALPLESKDYVSVWYNESDTGDMRYQFLINSGPTVAKVNQTGPDQSGANKSLFPFESLILQKTGSDYYVWAFNANGNASYFATATWTGSVNFVSVIFKNTSTTTPGNMIHGLDFVRFITGTWIP